MRAARGGAGSTGRGRARRRAVVAGTAVLSLLVVPGAFAESGSGGWQPPPRPDYTAPFGLTRVNETPAGTSSEDGVDGAALSADGRVAAYSTWADDLAPDVLGRGVYVEDLETGARRVLREAAPEDLPEDAPLPPPLQGRDVDLDGDGSTVAMTLVEPAPGDPERYEQGVVLVETATSATRSVTADVSGEAASPRLSDDGETVLFGRDAAAPPAEGQPPTSWDWGLWASRAGVSTEVADFGQATHPFQLALSGDGTRAVWYRFDADAGQAATPQQDLMGSWTAWTLDLATPGAQPASLGLVASGTTANRGLPGPGVSTDGRTIAVYDGEGVGDVVLRRLQGTTWASEVLPFTRGDGATPRLFGSLFDLDLSGDGRYVAFSHVGTGTTSTQPTVQVWRYDTQTGGLALVSAGAGAADGDDDSYRPALSADGHTVLFQSEAANLVPGDAPSGAQDLFVARSRPLSQAPAFGAGAALTVTDVTGSGMQLAWPAAADDVAVTAYEVLRDDVVVASTSARTATLTGLRGATDYAVAVRAVDGDLQRSFPLTRTVRTPTTTLDALVEGPRAVRLLWQASTVPGLTGYRVQRSEGTSTERTAVADVTATATEHLDTTADPGTDYRYVVQTLVGSTAADHAGPASASTPPADVSLGTDTAVRGLVRLSWAADRAGATYQVLRGPAGGALSPLDTTTALTHDDRTVVPGTAYDYRVDVVPTGAPARAHSTQARATARPLAGLSATEVDEGVRLLWDAPDAPTPVRVLRAVGGGAFAPLADVAAGTLQLVDAAAASGTAYRYRVDLVTGAHTGEASVTTRTLGTVTASAYVDQVGWGLARRGGRLTVDALGDSGRTGSATVLTRSWYAEDGTTLLSSPRAVALPLVLTPVDGWSGRYTGGLQLPAGTSEVTSITAALADRVGGRVQADALSSPLEVAGALDVSAGPHGSAVSYAVHRAGSSVRWHPAHGGALLLDGLAAGTDHGVTLHSGLGQVLGTAEGLVVKAGLVTPVTVPARLPSSPRVKVVDAQGAGVSAAVELVRAGQPSDTRYTWSGGTAEFSGTLLAGDAVELVVRPDAWGPTSFSGPFAAYRSVVTHPLPSLAAGEHEVVVPLVALPQARLSGVVRDAGVPVPGVTVTVSQLVDGRSWSFSATTGADGAYDLHALAGPADLRVHVPGDQTPFPVTGLAPLTTTPATRDVALPPRRTYTLVASVVTKGLGSSAEIPVAIDEWRVRAHWPVTLDVAGVRTDFGGSRLEVTAREGATGQVCANGREAGYPQGCTDVAFGTAEELPVKVVIAERGSVTASLVADGGAYDGHWSAELRRRTADGEVLAASGWGRGSALALRAPEAGEHELLVRAAGREARRLVQVDADGVAAAGALDLRAPSDLFEGTSSRLVLSTLEPQPGRLVDLLVEVAPRHPVGAGTLVVQIPAGSTLAGVQQDGQPVLPLPTVGPQGRVELPLGALGTARRRLQVRMGSAPVEAALVSAALEVEGVPHEIGRETVTSGSLTLVAPASTGTRTLPLSGRGPAGATVDLLGDDRLLASTVIGPGGLWRQTVTLPDAATEVALRAVTEAGGRQLVASRTVRVDTSKALLQKIRIEQTDGRVVEWSPATDGVARFPYVFVPHQPTIVTLTFDRPDAVRDVRAVLEGTSGPAARQPDGTYQAQISTQKFGAIDVWWRDVPPPLTSLASLPEPPTEAEGRALLPDGLADYVVVPDSDPASTTLALPSLAHDGATPTVKVTTRFERDVAYTPTAQDIADEQLSGTGVYGLKTARVTQPDGRETLEITGYLDQSLLPDGELSTLSVKSASGRRALSRGAKKGFGKWTGEADFKDLKEKIDTNKERYDDLKEVWDGFKELDERMKRLEHLQKKSAGCPPNSLGEISSDQIDELKKGIASSKLGTVMMKAISKVELKGPSMLDKMPDLYDAALSKVWDYKIGQLEAALGECPEPPEGDSGSGGGSSSGGDGDGGGSGSGESGGPQGAGTPIYDPSGYLYEGMRSNRVEGALAVVAQKDEVAGTWAAWNAAWFEQENPQTTDRNGRYGWDVPEGLWRVDYAKAGYLPARSAELRVLPPHFDVNIAMVSTVSAAVASASADDSSVTLVFDKPVRVDEVAGHVAVSRGAAVVPGTWAPLGAEGDPARPGGSLALRFRFVPTTAFAGGEVLQLVTDPSLLDYAARPLRAADTRTVTVPDAPGRPVVVSPGAAASPSPSASLSASASPSPSPSASAAASPSAAAPSASPSAAACAGPLRTTLAQTAVLAGAPAVVAVQGRPGQRVVLRAYSRPATTYRDVRAGVVPASGLLMLSVRPLGSTRMYAVEPGCRAGASVVLRVRTHLAAAVRRTGPRSYAFTGRVLPHRAGQSVRIYLVRADGRQVHVASGRTDAGGRYLVRRTFTGTGRFSVVAVTPTDLTNDGGRSTARPLLLG